ncbi:hypothetical protein [Glycomyces sp. MUSA5-2]|uniref:hypothetical protein n=1 Tax=Glycomyces sp. MUSA5-2 TaxID=2053002 RepID=UPI00300AC8D8
MTTDNAGTAELSGPKPESKFYGYYRRDWIDLCEDLRGNDRVVYGVLRSLVFEHRGVRNDVRILSLDVLCELIPGVNGKPTTVGTLRDCLRRLSKVGLVSDPEGNPLTTSSSKKAAAKALRIQIHDVPCNDYQPQWSNSDEKLKAIQSGWNSNQEAPAGQNSNQTGQNFNQSGWNPNPDFGDDQAERDPYSFSFPSSSSSPLSDPPSEPAPAAPMDRAGEEGMATPEKQGGTAVLEHSAVAVALVAEIPKGSGIETGKVVDAIVRRLSEGLDAADIRRELLKPLPRNVRSLTGLYLHRLNELGADEAAEPQLPPSAPRPDAHAYVDRYGSCTVCGLPEANPRHRLLVAVKAA